MRYFDGYLSTADTTLKISIKDYISRHGGPESIIHYRYSDFMSMVFITFIYGTALPVLFPITFIGLIILMLTERF